MAQASSVAAIRSRIVIIEDDRNIALLLAYNLQSAGHDIAVIASGDGAVEALFRLTPTLVILDWGLPILSGIEVLRQFRAHSGLRTVPVIMLTARNHPDDRSRAMAMGADVFLSKPFAMLDLMRHVENLVGCREIRPAACLAALRQS